MLTFLRDHINAAKTNLIWNNFHKGTKEELYHINNAVIAESALLRQTSGFILKATDDDFFLETIVDVIDTLMLFVLRLSKTDQKLKRFQLLEIRKVFMVINDICARF